MGEARDILFSHDRSQSSSEPESLDYKPHKCFSVSSPQVGQGGRSRLEMSIPLLPCSVLEGPGLGGCFTPPRLDSDKTPAGWAPGVGAGRDRGRGGAQL